MKKLLAILVLGLLWSGCSKNEVSVFECINQNIREKHSTLLVNLKDKTMSRAGVSYKISKINETYIIGKKLNDPYENELILNRFNGELIFSVWKLKDGKTITRMARKWYSCTKTEKLI